MKSLEWNAIEIHQDMCTYMCCTVKKNKKERTARNRIRRMLNPAVSCVAGIREFQSNMASNNIDKTMDNIGGTVSLHGKKNKKLLQNNTK